MAFDIGQIALNDARQSLGPVIAAEITDVEARVVAHAGRLYAVAPFRELRS